MMFKFTVDIVIEQYYCTWMTTGFLWELKIWRFWINDKWGVTNDQGTKDTQKDRERVETDTTGMLKLEKNGEGLHRMISPDRNINRWWEYCYLASN